jgi:hypothetical protein
VDDDIRVASLVETQGRCALPLYSDQKKLRSAD